MTPMILYAITIFVSAFLLFLVQPLIAKQILPWFGGTAAVWTTCLVFFQFALLAGYSYADWLTRTLTPKRQLLVHLLLVAVALVLLPIIPDASWKPNGDEAPGLRILLLLAATIGLPYFLLSSTSPLIQAWFARSHPGASPYRLFALSNLASMLALLGYPFLIEPSIATQQQAWGWSAGFVLFAALVTGTGWFALKGAVPAARTLQTSNIEDPSTQPPGGKDKSLWVLLSALGSVSLLAVSNHLTQNISSVPLMWVVPLGLYLLTFILCFDAKGEGGGWYWRPLQLPLLGVMVLAMCYALADKAMHYLLYWQIGLFSVGLFVICMFCHGELAARKPHAKYLTTFYLMISIGGALGAFLVGIVAPLVLSAYFELEIVLVAITALATYLLWDLTRGRAKRWRVTAVCAGALLTATAIGASIHAVMQYRDDAIYFSRNFYGSLRVREFLPPTYPDARRTLIHGTILHGDQYMDPRYSIASTTYYKITSGIGLTLNLKEKLMAGAVRRVGVVGLGVGTIASYGLRGDLFRFYDIDPDVVAVANSHFRYLQESRASVEVALGDARLNLEREPNQQFDVLVIDAFSSDSIPVHLITTEALDVYARHMKADGVIAFHVSNRFLDLKPVVARIAAERGFHVAWVPEIFPNGTPVSDWILLSKDQSFLLQPEIAARTANITPQPNWRVWTDDFNNLLQVLK